MERYFVLFTTGAAFGRAVLRELEHLDLPPRAIVLPGYPPPRYRAGASALAVEPPHRSRWPGARYHGRILHLPRARQAENARRLGELQCTFLLVACWPWLIGEELIAAVSAALNLHPSLLPAYRGPSPVAAQLAAEERRLGVTLHLLDQQFDRGDIVAQRALEDVATDAAAVERACARQGAQLFAAALRSWPDWSPRPQPR